MTHAAFDLLYDSNLVCKSCHRHDHIRTCMSIGIRKVSERNRMRELENERKSERDARSYVYIFMFIRIYIFNALDLGSALYLCNEKRWFQIGGKWSFHIFVSSNSPWWHIRRYHPISQKASFLLFSSLVN